MPTPTMRRRRNATPAADPVVLYVNHTSVIGGAERALLEHLRVMPATVRTGAVLCPPGELADELLRAGIKVVPFRGTALSFRLTPRSLWRGVIDVLSSVASIRRAARLTGSGVVHANSIRAGVIACLAHPFGGVPVIVHVHDVMPGGPVSRLLRFLLLRRSAALVAVSEFARTAFLDGVGSPQTPFIVLHNPIDATRLLARAPNRSESRRILDLPAGAPVLGIVGQITPWKGQHVAIRALAQVLAIIPEIQLLIVGEARFVDPSTRYDNLAYEQQLHGLVRDLNISGSVHFMGHREDIPVIMRALDLLLLPSTIEPLGRAAVEAMILGTPVIATRVGGPPEMIDDQQTGFLLSPKDPSDWARTIVSLLASPVCLSTIGVQAQSAIVSRLSMAEYVRHMKNLYEVAQRASAGPEGVSPARTAKGGDPSTSSELSAYVDARRGTGTP